MIESNMPLIKEESTPAEIVRENYRTAAIFKKYGIEYCCGGKWPLKLLCESKGVEISDIVSELQEVSRNISVSSRLPFHEWKVDFLTNYIINIHHEYLRRNMPLVKEQLKGFVEEHKKKHPSLIDLQMQFNLLDKVIVPHLKEEEDILFPYIQQVAHAYDSREPYAILLIKTLRKPVESIMNQEHETIRNILLQFRALTDNYTPPKVACTSHRLSYSLLKELDDDLVQHTYLEGDILFPRAIKMENELLQRQ
jgi:regulator of cell morphogenesis and NO signaling